MRSLVLPLLVVGVFCFAVGVGVGTMAGVGARTAHFAGTSAPGAAAAVGPADTSGMAAAGGGPRRHAALRPGEHHGGGGEKPEDNPLRHRSASELIALLNGAREDDDPERFHQAMRALAAHARQDPVGVAALLPRITRRGVMHSVCREVALHGGAAGLKAVSDFIADMSGNVEMRFEAIHALGALPPEAREQGRAALLDLMGRHFPHEMQHALVSSLGEVSGGDAFGAVLGLLGNDAVRVAPEIIVDVASRFGTPADAQTLLGLLGGTWTQDVDAAILRGAARMAKDGQILLDLLRAPPEGLDRRTIARALSDAAPWTALDPGSLAALLREETHPEIRGALARALVRAGGEDGLARLMELAADPAAAIDADSLGAALAEAPRRELVPAMVELLGDVRDHETLYRLTQGIITAAGREGVDMILDAIASGALRGHRLHPVAENLANAGNAADAQRLCELLDGVDNMKDAHVLLRTATRLAGSQGNEHLLSLITDAPVGHVRAAAADLLAHASHGEHLPLIMDALGQERFEPAQHRLARAAAMAGEEGVAQLGLFLDREEDVQRRHGVVGALGGLEDPAVALPVLVRTLLSDSDPGVRRHAAKILGNVPGENAAAALGQALARENDPKTREVLQEILQRPPQAGRLPEPRP